METIVKPVQETPELSGKFAKDFVAELLKKPSDAAIERNKRAQSLLKRLKK
jgi:hypothetical protein